MDHYRDLLRRAELWATGATIHDVKQLTGTIRTAMDALSDRKRKDVVGDKRRWAELMLARYARTLEDFVGHGDYKRAWRENPESAQEKELYAKLYP